MEIFSTHWEKNQRSSSCILRELYSLEKVPIHYCVVVSDSYFTTIFLWFAM